MTARSKLFLGRVALAVFGLGTLGPSPRAAARQHETETPVPPPAQKPTTPGQENPRRASRDATIESLIFGPSGLVSDGPPGAAAVALEEALTASAHRLRAITEACPRPLGAIGLDFARAAATRLDPTARRIATELAARVTPSDAEDWLLAGVSPWPPDAGAATPVPSLPLPVTDVLDALGRVGSEHSSHAIARFLAAKDPQVAYAAKSAALRITPRLLALGKSEEAALALRAFVTGDPRDLVLRENLAVVLGVYLEQPDEGRAVLAAYPETDASRGPLSHDFAELEVARAMIDFFEGASEGERHALERLTSARARVLAAPPAVEAAAETFVRVELCRAIVLLAQAQPDVEAAARAIALAVEHAPHENSRYRCDDALHGPAGPRAWLERLRRIGRPEIRRAFYHAMAKAAHAADPAASPDAEIPARSWSALFAASAALDDGDLDSAIENASELITRMQGSSAWYDRTMLGEAEYVKGMATLFRGDAKAASTLLESAFARIEELAREEVDSWAQDRIERNALVEAGAAPMRTSLASTEARMARSVVEAALAAKDRKTALRYAAAAVAADPFDDASVALELALATPAESNPRGTRERGMRALSTLPRSSGTLLDLARLAVALGDARDAQTLFERHVEWNALTPARKAIEEGRRARDPLLATIGR